MNGTHPLSFRHSCLVSGFFSFFKDTEELLTFFEINFLSTLQSIYIKGQTAISGASDVS